MNQPPKKQPKKNKSDTELNDAEYENIGRALESIVISGYAGKRRLFFANFLRGTFFGLGSAVGATLAIALIVWILSLGSDVPLIGRFFENIQNTIERAEPTQ